MKLRYFKICGFCFFFVILVLSGATAWAIEFTYKFNTGDRYRILSTVDHDIYVDRRLSYKAEIVNRIAFEVASVSGEKARLKAVFQTAEKTTAVGAVRNPGIQGNQTLFLWSRDYNSEFDQDKFGYMTVGNQYYMPMVRDVPVFPNKNINPGDAWNAPGLEVHDFRDNFGIEQPYRIPFTADYVYLGEREWKGTRYHAFSVSYRIFYEPPRVTGRVYPRRIIGASDQVVYWDINHGQAAAYEENFRTIIDLSDGQTWEYRGTAQAEVIEAPPMNKPEMIQEIAAEIGNIQDVTVRVSDEGIVISLENIQFAPDSAILMTSERPKLDLIAEILMRYSDRDILVGGHTAMAGTASGRLQLSLERAQTVADYFISREVRSPGRVVIRGYGAENPVAENRTEAGMSRNRRVEITILEN